MADAKIATYIIPYRKNNCEDRRADLLAVCGWLSTLADIETIIVEQDARPTLDAAAVGIGAKIIFVHNPGPFNKSWGFNIGARNATTDVLAFGDGDVLATAGFVNSVNQCQQGWHGAKPYKGIVDLTQEETLRVRGGEWNYVPPRAANAPASGTRPGEFVVFGGGLFVIRKSVFWQIGGFDERFIGWGGEDNAITIKLARFHAKLTGVTNHSAIHLWHPRSPADTFGQPNYQANRQLLEEYVRCTDSHLAELCARQRAVNGNIQGPMTK